jgi:demethylmenaquinone methyltransferase/2-methoxy-6-polyprenyl-1,4-benzoquinol methylase
VALGAWDTEVGTHESMFPLEAARQRPNTSAGGLHPPQGSGGRVWSAGGERPGGLMVRGPASLDLPSDADKAVVVEAMFDRIALRYDLLNRLLTLRLDQRWRAALIRHAAVGPRDVVVDLGCGTGDLCALAARTGARVIGVDFASNMLAAARRRGVRTPLVRADAGRLPLPAASASVVTSAFALRNFVSIARVLSEAARVLRPGGRLALLEVDEPTGALARWGHALYFKRIVPLVGALLSDAAAYAYLPRSTAYLPPAPQLLQSITAAGFCDVVKRPLSAGAVQLLVATRRP